MGAEAHADGGGSETDVISGSESSVETGPADWRRICDGSQDLKLAVRRGGYEGGNTFIAHELGQPYLYVRGDCHYWTAAGQPQNPEGFTLNDWQVTHAGILTSTMEEELSRELLYDRWLELAGHYMFPNPGGYLIEYSDGTSTIRCDLACSSEVNAPQELKDLTPVVNRRIQRLWDEGTELDLADPVRIDLRRVSGARPLTEEPCALEWPFDLDPAAVARDDVDDPSSPSRLVTDRIFASEIRSLRDQYLAGSVPEGSCNLLLEDSSFLFYEAADPMTVLDLWMRDAVPLENADGRIPLPEPPAGP